MIGMDIFDVDWPASLKVDVGNESCYNYILKGESRCDADFGAPSEIHVNTILMPIRYETNKDGTEDAAGRFTASRITQKRIFSFLVDVNDEWLHKLKLFQLWDTITIEKKGGSPIPILNLEVGDSETVDEAGTYSVEVTFEDPEIVEVSGCCSGIYDEGPYDDPCDDGGGTSPEPPDNPCEGFSVGASFDGDAINAQTTGGGEPNFKWYYDASGNGAFSLIGQGNVTSVVPAGAGVYRVVAIRGGCQDTDEVLVQDRCSLFEVVLTLYQGVISSRVISGQGNPSYKWYLDDVELPDTDSSIRPTESGEYRLEVEDGDCSGSDTIMFDMEESCALEVSITRSDNTLSADIDNCDGNAAYEWVLDDGAGPQVIGNNSTVEITESGAYFVNVVCGNCEASAYHVVMKPCNPCEGMSIEINRSGSTLNASTQGASGGLITWYLNDGSGKSEVGTGSSITITEGGMYTAIWEVGDCKIESDYLDCRGTISFDEICN